MFRSLLPPDAFAVVECAGTEELPVHPAEERWVAKAGPKRRRQFAQGRACARQALQLLGAAGEAAIIPRNEDRSPAWPTGFVGSISHTDAWCAAAVARREQVLALGIDVESREPLDEALARRICTPPEWEALARLGDRPAEEWAKLVFSAKESFYKAYFPETKTGLGFQQARVLIDPSAGRLAVELLADDKPALAGLRRAEGRFGFGDRHVFTAVVVETQG